MPTDNTDGLEFDDEIDDEDADVDAEPEKRESQLADLNDFQQRKLEKIANKDITTIMVVSFLLTPLGYWMVGKKGLAAVNLLTFNYLLLGIIVVPLHTRKIIKDAREELRRANVEGY